MNKRTEFLLAWFILYNCPSLCDSRLQISPNFKESPYPPEWAKASSSLRDFPVREISGENVTVIDPWVYLDRLGVFKTMVETTEKYFSSWGFNNTGNLLWGLPLQFGWQMTSGRLKDMRFDLHLVVPSPPLPLLRRQSPQSLFTGYNLDESQTVSPMSWWADMNYYLSIIPFLGALNSGILNPLKFPVYILKPTNVTSKLRDKFCTSVTECASRHSEVIEKWTEFFNYLRGEKDELAQVPIDPQKDATIGHLWDAHIRSLHAANPMFLDNLALLSKPEMHFGRGWAQLVDFIAATHFETNLNNTHTQQALALPPRILHSGDHPPFIPDLTKAQNAALLVINLFYDVQQITDGDLLYVWQKAMCSPKGRADGRDLLENLLSSPFLVAEDLIKLIVDFVKDHKC